MKARAFLLSLTLVCVAGGAVAATSVFQQSERLDVVNVKATTSTHDLTITSFAYTTTWRYDLDWKSNDYLVSNLDVDGNYCLFKHVLDNPVFDGGHLYSGEVSDVPPHFYVYTGVSTINNLALYTSGDYVPENKINLFAISDMISWEITMGEGNEITFDSPDPDYIVKDYNEVTKTYTFSNKPDTIGFKHYAYFSPTFSGAKEGDKLVIDRITIHYNC